MSSLCRKNGTSTQYLRRKHKDMEQKKDIELIENQAFRMGKKSEAKEVISNYAETSEERECFCF